MRDNSELRAVMVTDHLIARGIRDPLVLDAMSTVPRHEFVPVVRQADAYVDDPLPIGFGQTISQPYIVAWMAEALGLDVDDQVLEIGTGSGYAAAVLSLLTHHVTTVERIPELAIAATARLARLGFDNVTVVVGDGSTGSPAGGPFDAISVAAAAPTVDQGMAAQLSHGGRLVIPIGPMGGMQELTRLTAMPDGSCRTEVLGAVGFVPLIGEGGFPGRD